MPRKPDARIEKAREMYLAGSKLIDIAKELGVPEGTVRSWKIDMNGTATLQIRNATLQIKRNAEKKLLRMK